MSSDCIHVTIFRAEADTDQFKAALTLRLEVFVAEQGVPREMEVDEYDAVATHLVAELDGVVVGTLRLLRLGAQVKIGRVAVSCAWRRRGIGTRLMRQAMQFAEAAGAIDVVLDAQLDSMPFYEPLGFKAEGPVFDDAGIAHRRMRWRAC